MHLGKCVAIRNFIQSCRYNNISLMHNADYHVRLVNGKKIIIEIISCIIIIIAIVLIDVSVY